MTTAKKTTRTTTRKPRSKAASTAKKKTTSTKPRSVTVKKIELLPNALVHEILAAVVAERTKAKKIDILQKHGGDFLKSLFIWNYDDTIVSMIPEGDVPYQPLDLEAAPDPKKGIPSRSTLRNEWKRLYNFVKGGNDALNKIKRESMFINMLESIHPEEAKILCLVKDKSLHTLYPINREVVSEAYPDIKWGGRS
tara:strand:- start:2452 stop:3036 length:585 start_codon:yes stop_codon:yes gene_type:complete